MIITLFGDAIVYALIPEPVNENTRYPSKLAPVVRISYVLGYFNNRTVNSIRLVQMSGFRHEPDIMKFLFSTILEIFVSPRGGIYENHL